LLLDTNIIPVQITSQIRIPDESNPKQENKLDGSAKSPYLDNIPENMPVTASVIGFEKNFFKILPPKQQKYLSDNITIIFSKKQEF